MKKYYVAGFLFSEDYSKIVLIKKNKPEWQAGFLNGTGGKIELTDDSPLFAMIREFKEETGYEVKTWQEFCKLSGKDWEVYFFKAVGDVTKVSTQESEEIVVIPISEYRRYPLIQNLNWLIPMALDEDKIKGQINYL
jgi:8-oxo-dGTP diphosphatase